jgi:glycerophosphoryl diester phosphodiesterase
MARTRTALLACALALVAAAPAAATEIHAHRGAPVENGVPVSPENSMAAFERAVANGADRVELDSKLAADGTPVVFHDPTLEKVTACSGRVDARTAAQLRAECPLKILGTTSGANAWDPNGTEPIPALADVLAWAKEEGVRLHLEIKNIPIDPDFDRTPAFARTILEVVKESGIAAEQVLIQSFWPPNLDEARAYGYDTALLTLQPLNEPAIAFATAQGYGWNAPQWSPLHAPTYVAAAHAAGRKVATWTLDDAPRIQAAAAAGVDAVISNDLLAARAALGR